MEYRFEGQLVRVMAPTLTSEVIREVGVRLLEGYKASGETVSHINEAGQRALKVVKLYDSRLANLADHAERVSRELAEGHLEPGLMTGLFIAESVVLPAAGESLHLPKGITTYSTHPQVDNQQGKPNGRSRTVTVHHVTLPFFDPFRDRGWNGGEVNWVGTGGYWFWVKLSDLIQAQSKQQELSEENA